MAPDYSSKEKLKITSSINANKATGGIEKTPKDNLSNQNIKTPPVPIKIKN